MFGLLAASALVALASRASADEITGPIQRIDRIGNMFLVHGTQFAASPQNTVGVRLADLRPGDRVTVFYEGNPSYRQPWNAMVLRRHG
jgi:hypothetical protein